jgi:orotate phosphoribosyltransferase-like protein
MSFTIECGYGWTTFKPETWTKKLQACAKKVASLQKKHKIDALAYTGSSGAAAAYVLGVALDLPVVYVRKKGESSHGNKVEANTSKPISNYLIIDDFICSGATVESVVKGIEKYAKDNHVKPPNCVGVFLYAPTDEKFKTVSMYVNKEHRDVKVFK